jgi:hypothetical protein
VRSSNRIDRKSATATDASSPTLAGETGFQWNHRAVNGRSICLDHSRRDTTAEHSFSSGIANARDRGSGQKHFAAYSRTFGKFINF